MGDNDPFMRNQNAAVQGRAKAQNRANVLQLKMIGQNHPTGLTSNLLKLFEPRPPLEYKPPPEKRKCPPYTGMAHLVSHFAEPNDPEYAPPVPKAETPAEKRARIHQSRLQKGAEKVAEELQKYDPNSDPNIAGDPYKTLFVAKLSYETTESRLKREFESYGPIKRVRLVHDADSQKPRGYAFIEYMHTRDMKAAYKQGDGKKIDGRRVLVDVERGRTVPNWRPRRLGGGLGTSRISVDDGSQRNSVREQQQSGGPSRSEEPRAREDRPDREKSRERARDKDVEREKSRERSHDRSRDRDREDRHRDRDRRDKGHDRDRDRGSRSHDRDRTRDRDRDHRRERTRDRERDYDVVDKDRDVVDYDSKHDRHSKRGYDQPEAEDEGEWHRSDYDQYEHNHRERGHSSRYDDVNDGDRYDHYPSESHHRYDQRDQDGYHYGRASSRDNMDQD